MAGKLKKFVQCVLRLTPAYGNVIGGDGVPWSANASGTAHAGADTIQKLHHATLDFAQAYNDPQSSGDTVRDRAREVESLLMVAVTLSALAEQEGTRLIDELQALVEQRFQPADALSNGRGLEA